MIHFKFTMFMINHFPSKVKSFEIAVFLYQLEEIQNIYLKQIWMDLYN